MNKLLPGQILRPDQELTSENGYYRLILQVDGNFVLYYDGINVKWQSHTDGHATKECIMQTDGNLVIYGYDGRVIWQTKTDGNPGSHLILQNDGNAVIYHPTAIWETHTSQ